MIKTNGGNMKKIKCLIFLFVFTIGVFAQNYNFNNAILKSLLKISDSAKTKTVIFETTVCCFPKDYQYKKLIKLISNKKAKNGDILNLLENMLDLNTNFDGELNICNECFQKEKRIKVNLVSDLNKYKKEFNSQFCINPKVNIKKGKAVLEIKQVQPVEIGKNEYLLIFLVKKSYFFTQNNQIAGLDIFNNSNQIKIYVYVVKNNKIISAVENLKFQNMIF